MRLMSAEPGQATSSGAPLPRPRRRGPSVPCEPAPPLSDYSTVIRRLSLMAVPPSPSDGSSSVITTVYVPGSSSTSNEYGAKVWPSDVCVAPDAASAPLAASTFHGTFASKAEASPLTVTGELTVAPSVRLSICTNMRTGHARRPELGAHVRADRQPHG